MRFMTKEKAKANGLDRIKTEEELMNEEDAVDVNGEEVRLARDIIATSIDNSSNINFSNKRKGLKDLRLAIEDLFDIIYFEA